MINSFMIILISLKGELRRVAIEMMCGLILYHLFVIMTKGYYYTV